MFKISLWFLVPVLAWAAFPPKHEFVGQVRIGSQSTTFNTKVALEVESTTLASLPVPRLTTAQRTGISGPPTGALADDSTLNQLHRYNGSNWEPLNPLTTKGDIQTFSTVPARLAVGTDGQVLTADSAQATGVKWATTTPAPDQSYELRNHALAASVGGSALTISLKNKSGSDPSAGDPVQIAYRNATSGTGTYSTVSTAAAVSTTVSSGSTAGFTDGTNQYLYVYGINNSGSTELAWASVRLDEGSLFTTTAEGGAGAADSKNTLYSTTSRSGVPIRLLGRMRFSLTTAGTWNETPDEIALVPFWENVPVTSSTSAERIERVSFSGANRATVCSASPCSVLSQSGSWITSVTRSGAGDYTVNIATGTFSATPICSNSVEAGSVNAVNCSIQNMSSTSIRPICWDDTATSRDVSLNIVCIGPR